MQISSRFSEKIYYPILIASVCCVLISLFLLELFFVLLTILWLCEKLGEKKKSFDVFHAAILVFGFFRILSILFSKYPSISYQSFYKDALFYLSFFSMSFYFKVLSYQKTMKVMQYFLLASIFVAVVGIIKFDLSMVDRASSFSSGYSTYSSYLLVAFSLLIFVPIPIINEFKATVKIIGYSLKFTGMIISADKFKAVVKIVGLSLMLTGIATSLGRSNLFIAVVVLVFALIIKKINWKSTGAIILFTFLLSYISFQVNSVEVDRRIEQPAALSDRGVIVRGAEDLFFKFEKPVFGYGPRTFHQIFPYVNQLTDKGIGSWHNDFVQIYFESGFFGLASFLSLLLIIIYYSYKLLRKQLDLDKKNLLWALLVGTVVLILSSLTAGFIDSPVLSVLFALLAALLSGIKYDFSTENAY
jgi:O-antigen ligase